MGKYELDTDDLQIKLEQIHHLLLCFLDFCDDEATPDVLKTQCNDIECFILRLHQYETLLLIALDLVCELRQTTARGGEQNAAVQE